MVSSTLGKCSGILFNPNLSTWGCGILLTPTLSTRCCAGPGGKCIQDYSKYQIISQERIIKFDIHIYYGELTLDINPERYAPLSTLSAPDNMNCRAKHCMIKLLKNKMGAEASTNYSNCKKQKKSLKRLITKKNSEIPDQAQI